jgi:hypothetical protein
MALQGELGGTSHAWLEGEGDPDVPIVARQIGRSEKYNIIFIFKILKIYK